MKYPSLVLFSGLLLLPQTAFAHLVSTRFGEFYSGVLHPLTTLIHLVPWMAIALLVGLQKHTDYSKWALLIFPGTTFLGAAIGGEFTQPDWLYWLNLASFFVGILVALALNLKPAVFIAVLAIFGFSHGFANAETELRGSDFLLYVIGVAAAAYLLIALLSAASKLAAQHAQWSSVAVRAGGSWILAVGIIYSGYTLMSPAGVVGM